jgi:peptidoglycan/LPS O-acetylase OafA/YrhL
MAEIPIAEPRLAARAATPKTAASGKPKFAYIDCLRGYAVLMVMVNHVTYAMPKVPWRVHQLGAFGWHGVQLFFLASAITLLMSSSYERDRTGQVSASDFFVRRFLRIAPMYYLAALLYWLILPNPLATLPKLLASLLFVNSWHPVTTTTTDDWQVVPGGWSIGVEFTFYYLFPFFLAFATSLRRAALVLLVALVAGMIADSLAMAPLVARYGTVPADNFLYYWFFNQASVFALGAVAFYTIRAAESRPDVRLTRLLRERGGSIRAASLILLLAVVYVPYHFAHQLLFEPAIPQFLAASACFFVFILAMSQARQSILINPLVANIGKISFSAYLLHFAVIDLVLNRHRQFFHMNSTGWTSIAVLCGVSMIVIVLTCIISTFTYLAVEKPMMQLAKRLTRRRPLPVAEPVR